MASFMTNGSKVSLEPLVLVCIYRSLSQISLFDNPFVAPECFPAYYLFGWLESYLHAQHIASSRPIDPQMMRYHGKDRGKSPPNQAFFVSLCTGRISHRIGSEFMVEPYNPYCFIRQFGYTPTVPGLSSSVREIVDLPTGLRFWRTGILSRARQTTTFLGKDSPHTPPTSYKAWLSNLFLSKAPRSSSVKNGKGKGLPAGVCPSILVFQSSGSSKRKHSSSSTVEDRDPKHARAFIKTPSRPVDQGWLPQFMVVEVSSSISRQEHTELVDTRKSPKCLTIEVAESCPPSLPTLTITQGAKAILLTGASSL
ncbi:hypothetical protein LIER_16233 [Lithospermum erythrorhizon]|uniref:Aminotransferase-like plant mobile domain-containing protein n=1 Tax=Lithospermum erythrorhizon TaxID=34254 RepID=A0AAV3Q8F6_LITER